MENEQTERTTEVTQTTESAPPDRREELRTQTEPEVTETTTKVTETTSEGDSKSD